MSFQMGIGSLGGTVFSGGTLYLSANYGCYSNTYFEEHLRIAASECRLQQQ